MVYGIEEMADGEVHRRWVFNLDQGSARMPEVGTDGRDSGISLQPGDYASVSGVLRLVVDEHHLQRVLDDADVVSAGRALVARLMQAGASPFSRFHNQALADAALVAASED